MLPPDSETISGLDRPNPNEGVRAAISLTAPWPLGKKTLAGGSKATRLFKKRG